MAGVRQEIAPSNNYSETTTRNRQPFPYHHHQNSKYFNNMAGEYIPLRHGSPESRRNYVYPSQTSPIPAFQMPTQQSPKYNPLQDMKTISRGSPLAVKSPKVQDSSFSTTDTDETVAKISAMFPTVSETHIRMLMNKYHNREALVISALQVEKNPITTPGPYATPPPQRNIHHPTVYALHMTPPLGLHTGSRGGSPILRPGSGTNSTYTGSPRIGDGFRSSPRPHSSPKLKLSCRYMKSVFPKAEETIILEILQNNENNIQKTTEILKEMGYQKKDTVKAAQQKMQAKLQQEKNEENRNKETPPVIIPKMKTIEEKTAIKLKLRQKYKEVAEQLITMALESVDYNENRANQILEIMVQEDNEKTNQPSTSQTIEEERNNENELKPPGLPVSHSRQSIKSLIKSEKIDKNNIYNRISEENSTRYKSTNITEIKGPNPDLTKGPNETLLLTDYLEWKGPNRICRQGPQNLAKGPNRNLLGNRSYQPCGSNPELRKGPQIGLAKGGIFSQLKSIVVGDTHGK